MAVNGEYVLHWTTSFLRLGRCRGRVLLRSSSMEGQSTLLVHWVGPCYLGTGLAHPLVQNACFLYYPDDQNTWRFLEHPFQVEGFLPRLYFSWVPAILHQERTLERCGFPGARASHSHRLIFEPTCFISFLSFLLFIIFLFGRDVLLLSRSRYLQGYFPGHVRWNVRHATWCTGALKYSTPHFVRLTTVLSRPPPSYARSMSYLDALLVVVSWKIAYL